MKKIVQFVVIDPTRVQQKTGINIAFAALGTTIPTPPNFKVPCIAIPVF